MLTWVRPFPRSLELHSSCSFDYVAVIDGPPSSANYLGRICNDSSRIFTSSTNRMTVQFRSDASVQNYGFSAWYNSFPRGKRRPDLTREARWIYPTPSYECIVVPGEIKERLWQCLSILISRLTRVSLRRGRSLAMATRCAE